jgi:hypothetical protein
MNEIINITMYSSANGLKIFFFVNYDCYVLISTSHVAPFVSKNPAVWPDMFCNAP